jgi:hypothetical protein
MHRTLALTMAAISSIVLARPAGATDYGGAYAMLFSPLAGLLLGISVATGYTLSSEEKAGIGTMLVCMATGLLGGLLALVSYLDATRPSGIEHQQHLGYFFQWTLGCAAAVAIPSIFIALSRRSK